jgi:hypothetical protein
MPVPNYTYLKLKMSGPNGIINISTTSQHAYQCDVKCIELAEALAESLSIITSLSDVDQDIPGPSATPGALSHWRRQSSSSSTLRPPKAGR